MTTAHQTTGRRRPRYLWRSSAGELLYRRRRDATIDALESLIPEARWQGAAAGLHLHVWLPAGVQERTLAIAAYEAIEGPLSEAERDQFLMEQKLAGALLGIPPHHMPSTMAELDTFLVNARRRWAAGARSAPT